MKGSPQQPGRRVQAGAQRKPGDQGEAQGIIEGDVEEEEDFEKIWTFKFIEGTRLVIL